MKDNYDVCVSLSIHLSAHHKPSRVETYLRSWVFLPSSWPCLHLMQFKVTVGSSCCGQDPVHAIVSGAADIFHGVLLVACSGFLTSFSMHLPIGVLKLKYLLLNYLYWPSNSPPTTSSSFEEWRAFMISHCCLFHLTSLLYTSELSAKLVWGMGLALFQNSARPMSRNRLTASSDTWSTFQFPLSHNIILSGVAVCICSRPNILN